MQTFSKKCKAAGFRGGSEVAALAGEKKRTMEKWPDKYPRRLELILKGLLFERATVKAESLEE